MAVALGRVTRGEGRSGEAIAASGPAGVWGVHRGRRGTRDFQVCKFAVLSQYQDSVPSLRESSRVCVCVCGLGFVPTHRHFCPVSPRSGDLTGFAVFESYRSCPFLNSQPSFRAWSLPPPKVLRNCLLKQMFW